MKKQGRNDFHPCRLKYQVRRLQNMECILDLKRGSVACQLNDRHLGFDRMLVVFL